MTDHPITPPPELVQQLCDSAALSRSFKNISIREVDVLLILEAFQAGADQELEACCEWIVQNCGKLHWWEISVSLRAARRPKQPSLKEQALEALEVEDDAMPLRSLERSERFDTIRRALEQLND